MSIVEWLRQFLGNSCVAHAILRVEQAVKTQRNTYMARRKVRRAVRATGAAIQKRLEKRENRDTVYTLGTAAARGFMASRGTQLPTFKNIDPDLLYGAALLFGSRLIRDKAFKEAAGSIGKTLLAFGVAGGMRTLSYENTTPAIAGTMVPGVGGMNPYGWEEVVSGDGELDEVEEGEI